MLLAIGRAKKSACFTDVGTSGVLILLGTWLGHLWPCGLVGSRLLAGLTWAGHNPRPWSRDPGCGDGLTCGG